MKKLTVAAASVNQTPLDWVGNKRRLKKAILQARESGAFLVVCPELSVSGYGAEDHFFSDDVLSRSLAIARELAEECPGIVALVGLPFSHRMNLFNGVALLAGGKLHGLVAKHALAGDGIHYEPRWFKSWPLGVADSYSSSELPYELPVGDLIFDLAGVRLGLEICEDAWVAQRRGVHLAGKVEVIANPSASHFAFGKYAVREKFVLDGSRRFGVAYIYANLLGNEAGRAVYDGANLIASRGRMVTAGARLSFNEVVVDTAQVDLAASGAFYRRTFANTSLANDGHDPLSPVIVRLSAAALGLSEAKTASPASPAKVRSDYLASQTTPASLQMSKNEEFSRAAALGLWDYLTKSKSQGFTLSLSGGADSATVASLAYLSWRLAIDELGAEGAAERLSYSPSLAKAARSSAKTGESLLLNDSPLAALLLRCVYQSTENNSAETLATARSLAGELGAQFLHFDVAPLVSAYSQMVSRATGDELSWERAAGEPLVDAAMQNLQARVRVPGVWMLANLSNSLLLTTGNRSEIAVGYTTMDGDSAGCFNPIGGVSKHFIRQWLSSMAESGLPLASGARLQLSALSAVASLAPSAELRPLALTQTDEKDLMPYELLDDIERLMVLEKKSPLETFQLLIASWSSPLTEAAGGLPSCSRGPQLLALYIERFSRLWSRNQWKRERFAPSLHLDDRNLDPRSWCRFPILSAGFSEEIKELKSLVQQKRASSLQQKQEK